MSRKKRILGIVVRWSRHQIGTKTGYDVFWVARTRLARVVSSSRRDAIRRVLIDHGVDIATS